MNTDSDPLHPPSSNDRDLASSVESGGIYIPKQATAAANVPEADSPETREAAEASNHEEDTAADYAAEADGPKQRDAAETKNPEEQDNQEKGSDERQYNDETGGSSTHNVATSARLTTANAHTPSPSPAGRSSNPAGSRSDAGMQASSGVADVPRFGRRLRLQLDRWSRLSTTVPQPPQSWLHSGNNSPPHIVVPSRRLREGARGERAETLGERLAAIARGEEDKAAGERVREAASDERAAVPAVAGDVDNGLSVNRNEDGDAQVEALGTEIQLEMLTYQPGGGDGSSAQDRGEVRGNRGQNARAGEGKSGVVAGRRRSRRQQGRPPEGEAGGEGEREGLRYGRRWRRANSEGAVEDGADDRRVEGERRRVKSEGKGVWGRNGRGQG